MGVGTDAQGHAYLALASPSWDPGATPFSYLYKLNKDKKLLWRVELSNGKVITPNALRVDDAGNTYLTLTEYTYSESFQDYFAEAIRLRKYAPDGRKLWGLTLKESYYADLALADDALFVISHSGEAAYRLRKYGLGGTLFFDQAVQKAPLRVASGDGAVFIAGLSYTTINPTGYLAKYSGAGALLWQRASGMNDSSLSLSTDASGNAYVAGAVARSGESDLFMRKFTPGGVSPGLTLLLYPVQKKLLMVSM